MSKTQPYYPPHKPLGPGKHLLVSRGGQLVEVPTGTVKKRDNNRMVSMAMGCPDPAQQRERLQMYAGKGIDAHYDPKTAELIFDGGFHQQKRAAKLHGLEVD